MKLRSLSKRINNNVQEISALGLSSMMRHLHSKISKAKNNIKINTKYGPIYLRPRDSDNIVMSKIFVDREYDLDALPQGKSVRNVYNHILSSGKTPLIIDAGGNIGLASRFFATAYPGSQVILIEPDPNNCTIARNNTAGFENIVVLEAAIGARSGYVSLQTTRNESWATRTQHAENGIPIVTIQEIKERYADGELLIVKIDIEGFEADLFSSALEWIAETTAIVIEPHDWMLPGGGSSRNFQRAIMQGEREILIMGENLAFIKGDL